MVVLILGVIFLFLSFLAKPRSKERMQFAVFGAVATIVGILMIIIR
jgi:hypothetical protein